MSPPYWAGGGDSSGGLGGCRRTAALATTEPYFVPQAVEVIQGGTPCSGAGSHCFVLSMVSVSPFLLTLLL